MRNVETHQTLIWQWSSFEQLSVHELYEIVSARQNVFVVEQRFFCLDTDGYDQKAYHLMGWKKNGDARELVAYLRVLPAGVKYPNAAIGRVLTAASVRGQGLGKTLMREGISRVESDLSSKTIVLSAQAHLEKFYQDLGFYTQGEPYLEEGSPHIHMVRTGER